MRPETKVIEMTFAIIDTNVLVSYFLSDKESPPVAIVNKIFDGEITPVFNCYLINGYRKVLSRKQFELDRSTVNSMLDIIQISGFGVESFEHTTALSDMKDVPTYELATLTREDGTFLITGNVKHFPNDDFVVTPKQFVDMLENKTDGSQ